MSNRILIKLQPLEWFKENAYIDPHYQVWWIDEKHSSEYEMQYRNNIPFFINKDEIEIGIFDVSEENYKWYKWAVEKIVTKEEYPEYFL